MENRRGFTLIELAIVIVIIGILVTVGTISMRGMQAAARDKEREADVAAIAMYLESLYPKEIRDSSNTIIKKAGSYPPLPYRPLSSNNLPLTDSTFAYMMRDIQKSALQPPNGLGNFISPNPNNDGNFPPCYDWYSCYSQYEPDDSQLNTQNYLYRPIGTINGSEYVCVSESIRISSMEDCRSFKIYYNLESSPSIVKSVESKHK